MAGITEQTRLPRLVPCPFTLVVLAALLAGPASAGGGAIVKLKTDDTADGYYYNALDTGRGRFCSFYDAGECGFFATILGVRVRDLDQSIITPGVDDYRLLIDLRHVDPNNPGYADLTPAGLIVAEDLASQADCSTTGFARTTTFGGGTGVSDPLTPYLITAAQPANNDPFENVDFCGILLDTSSNWVMSSRSQAYAPGENRRTTIGFNHFLELVILPPGTTTSLRMSGSSRFPGDRGLPVMFARRQCNPADVECKVAAGDTGPTTTTDDYITAHMVVDRPGNAGLPLLADIALVADISGLGLGEREITHFFSLVGGSLNDRILNPVSFPAGRSVINFHVNVPIPRRFLPFLPVDLPVRLELRDPNDANTPLINTVGSVLGLRPGAGYYDADLNDAYFTTTSPVRTGDALGVFFAAVDLPRPGSTTAITGAEFVAGEFGTVPGLAGFELRREDPLFPRAPDLTAHGLLRRIPGPISAGQPPTTVYLDFTDLVMTPETPGVIENLVGMALLNPGDQFELGLFTALAASESNETFIGNSHSLLEGSLPVLPLFDADLAIRLDLNGELALLEGATRSENPSLPPRVRTPRQGYTALDQDGNPLE